MRKRLFLLTLAVLACLGLALPAGAAQSKAPEIQWLSVPGRPYAYNDTLGWLTLSTDTGFMVIDLSSGAQILSYDIVLEFTDGLALVMKDEKCGFIDKDGELVVPMVYDAAYSFSEGLAPVFKADGDDSWQGWWGFIDQNGQEVVPLEYQLVFPFVDGRACVMKEDEQRYRTYGFIDKTGKEIIPPTYDDTAYTFLNGQTVMYTADEGGSPKCEILDKNGSVVASLPYDSVHAAYVSNLEFLFQWTSEGLIPVSKDGKYGYADTAGNEVIPPEYDRVYPFSDGLACVGRTDGFTWQYGYIDKTGQEVIPLTFDDAYPFSDGLATVKQDEQWGVIDKTGKAVVPLAYNLQYSPNTYYWRNDPFLDGLAPVRESDGLYGVMDRKGATLFPAEYTDVIPTLATVPMDDTYTYSPLWAVGRGETYGVFRNPYWTASQTEGAGGFPVVPVAAGAAAVVVIAALAVVLITRKKAAPAGGRAAVRTAANGAQRPQAQGRAAAPRPAEQLPPEAGGIPCPCGTVNPPGAKFCAGCGRPAAADNRCPACGCPNEAGAKFCQECGKPMAVSNRCPACGCLNEAGARFCQECGSPLAGGEG